MTDLKIRHGIVLIRTDPLSCQVLAEIVRLPRAGWPGWGCYGLVVVLADGQALVEAAKEAFEGVALGSGGAVPGVAAAVIVGAGAG